MAKAGNDETSSFKLDRKTTEKNRRIRMKSLCSKLVNLIPPSHFKVSKDLLSQQNQISYVITYINELKERVANLERRKQALQLQTHADKLGPADVTTMMTTTSNDDPMSPVLELKDLGNNTLQITLISSLNRSFMLYQIISVVEEEGGDVVCASFSTLGKKVFHSLHVEAKIWRVGVETSRVQKRLQNLVNHEGEREFKKIELGS